MLQLEAKPLLSNKVVADSQGVLYTLKRQATMSIKLPNARCSSSLRVYVAEGDNLRIAGRYDILLAKSWKEKFAPVGQGGREIHRAAPSLLKGVGSKRESWPVPICFLTFALTSYLVSTAYVPRSSAINANRLSCPASKEWEEKALEHEKQNRAKAEATEAEFEQSLTDGKVKGKQPSRGQPTSASL